MFNVSLYCIYELLIPCMQVIRITLNLNLGFDERRGRGDRGNANLDPKHEMDVPANREFYKHNDVRPPYTYAALIRYVSLDSFHSLAFIVYVNRNVLILFIVSF